MPETSNNLHYLFALYEGIMCKKRELLFKTAEETAEIFREISSSNKKQNIEKSPAFRAGCMSAISDLARLLYDRMLKPEEAKLLQYKYTNKILKMIEGSCNLDQTEIIKVIRAKPSYTIKLLYKLVNADFVRLECRGNRYVFALSPRGNLALELKRKICWPK